VDFLKIPQNFFEFCAFSAPPVVSWPKLNPHFFMVLSIDNWRRTKGIKLRETLRDFLKVHHRAQSATNLSLDLKTLIF